MSVESDCDFVSLVDQISAIYECLPCQEDKKNVEYWIGHLSGELDKIKRNEYAQNLFDLITCGILKYPFNEPPPAGRLPDYCDIVNPLLNPYATPVNASHFERDSEDPPILSRFKLPNCFIRRPAKRMLKELKEKCKPPTPPCHPCPPMCEPIDKCKEVTRRKISPQTVGCPEDVQNREEIDKLIDAICPTTLLDEFAAQVARFTCDNGQEMFRFISKETNCFRKLVQSVFESLNKDLIKALDEEQRRVKDTYENWERFVFTKTKAEMDAILDLIPDFNWNEMRNNRRYVWFKLYPKMKAEMMICPPKSENRMRSIIKRKTWLAGIARDLQEGNVKRRAEVTQLSKLLSSLTMSYANSQNKLTKQLAMMESEANALRNRIIQNQKIIENLLSNLQADQRF